MSEGAAEGGAPLSEGQFGDGLTETTDLPPGETAQNPGDGIFAQGFYPWYMSQNAHLFGVRTGRLPARAKKRKKRDE